MNSFSCISNVKKNTGLNFAFINKYSKTLSLGVSGGINYLDLSSTPLYSTTSMGLNLQNNNTNYALVNFNGVSLKTTDIATTSVNDLTIYTKYACRTNILPILNFRYPNVIKISNASVTIGSSFNVEMFSLLNPGTLVSYSIAGVTSVHLSGAALNGTLIAPYQSITYSITGGGGSTILFNVTGTKQSSIIYVIPLPPTGLSVTAYDSNSITVTFTESTGATSYRATATNGANVTQQTFASGSQIILTGLIDGTLYTITIRAINAGGTSVASTSVTQSTKPNPPTALSIQTPDKTSIRISFAVSTTTNLDSYTVTATPVNGGITVAQTTGSTLNTIVGLVSYTKYNISVVAVKNGISSINLEISTPVATTLDITTTAVRSTNGDYTTLTFNNSDSNFSIANFKGSLNILAVGGGGGGGFVFRDWSFRSGAGGGGGFVEQTSLFSTVASIMGSISIGSGGNVEINGGDGGTTIVTLTNIVINAYGGGGGGSKGSGVAEHIGFGRNGGSGGGGGSYSGTNYTGGAGVVNQGYGGGKSITDRGGGGGGAGGVGQDGGTGIGPDSGTTIYNGPGNGGPGKRPTLAGLPTQTYFAGGGGFFEIGDGTNRGGGARAYYNESTTPNTGGGGAWYGNRWPIPVSMSRFGATGIVIIAIPTIPT